MQVEVFEYEERRGDGDRLAGHAAVGYEMASVPVGVVISVKLGH